jgi:hypothetical protein
MAYPQVEQEPGPQFQPPAPLAQPMAAPPAVDVPYVPAALAPITPKDKLTFHDTLFSNSSQVGDELGSCVIVELSPGPGQLQRRDSVAGRHH